MIGTDAFQETPIVEITRQITKHNYLVTNLDDLPRIMREAFFLANSGRPGPVLVDVPKDIQQQLTVPNWDVDMKLGGYISRLPPVLPSESVLQQVRRWWRKEGLSMRACDRWRLRVVWFVFESSLVFLLLRLLASVLFFVVSPTPLALHPHK